jgi:hypothetical protein
MRGSLALGTLPEFGRLRLPAGLEKVHPVEELGAELQAPALAQRVVAPLIAGHAGLLDSERVASEGELPKQETSGIISERFVRETSLDALHLSARPDFAGTCRIAEPSVGTGAALTGCHTGGSLRRKAGGCD